MPAASDTRLGRLLQSVGWSDGHLVEPEDWPRGRAADKLLSAAERRFQPLYLVVGGVRELIALEAPLPALPSYTETLGLYRDFSPEIASQIDASRAYAAPGEHLLLVDPSRFYLYDLDRREPLLFGEAAHEWDDRLTTLFSPKGSPRREMSRLPRREPQQLAHHLGRFLESFRTELGAASRAADEKVERFALQILLSAFYTLREPREVVPPVRTFWEGFLAREAEPLTNRRLLEAIGRTFDQLYRRYSLRLFQLDRGAQAFEEQWTFLLAEQRPLWLWEQLSGFMLQMPSKYAADVFETCLLDPEDLRLSLRQALRESESFTRRIERDGAVVYSPLEIDVATEGLGWGLEALRGCLDLMEGERELQRERLRRYGTTGQTLDLFQSASAGADALGVVEDPVMTVLGDTLRWRGLADPSALQVGEFLAAVTIWEWLWAPEHPERQRYHASMAAMSRLLCAMG